MIILLGNGILGSSIKEIFEKASSKTHTTIKQFVRKDFDLGSASLESINKIIDPHSIIEYPPTFLINCMGYTDVDRAEDEKDLAYAVNAAGTYKLAVLCKKYNIKLVHISSDFIFDGRSAYKYSEFDHPSPVNYYGYTKLMGERMIKNSGCEYLIVRTGWLYNDEKGIVPYFIDQLKNGEKKLRGIKDQTIAPTYAKDLAKQMLLMIENNLSGTFHAMSKGDVHPDVLLKYLAEKLRIEKEIEETSRFTFYNKRAKRPYLSLLSNSNLEALGLDQMPHWKDSVDAFIKRGMH